MKRTVAGALVAMLFLAGLSLLAYPFVANEWNDHRQKQLMDSYQETVTERETGG